MRVGVCAVARLHVGERVVWLFVRLPVLCLLFGVVLRVALLWIRRDGHASASG